MVMNGAIAIWPTARLSSRSWLVPYSIHLIVRAPCFSGLRPSSHLYTVFGGLADILAEYWVFGAAPFAAESTWAFLCNASSAVFP